MTGTSGNLTICTVSFDSATFLDLNVRHVSSLNGDPWLPSWVVVENRRKGDTESVLAGRPDVRVVEGLDDAEFSYVGGAGLHHGGALDIGRRLATTRYLLILDPDFFIVQGGWVRAVTEHMARKGLSFFGAPWHPRWFKKLRHYPACPHCLFVDQSRVDLTGVSLRPAVARGALAGWARDSRLASGAVRRYRRLVNLVRWLILNRLEVGIEKETAHAVREMCRGPMGHRFECLTPVYRPKRDFLGPGYVVSRVANTLERLLPDRFRYVPGRSGAFSESGFAERGLPDLARLGWEEFLWRGRPFGFHVRCFSKSREERDGALESLPGILSEFEDREVR